MIKEILKTTMLSLPLVLVLGCGSGGGSSNTSQTAETTTGVFIDSAVSGLTYTCSSGASDVTNDNGEFTCPTADTVSFSIGGIVLGEVAVGDVITPNTLFPDNYEAALNVAQFLQTIDSDGDPSNGITPDMTMVTNIFNSLGGNSLDFTSEDFDTTLLMASGVPIVSEEDALEHLNESLADLGEDTIDAPIYMPLYTKDYGKELHLISSDDITMVKDIAIGSGWSYPNFITKLGSKVYFVAEDSNDDYGLWVSDGTEAGTTLVKTMQVSSLYVHNDLLYMSGYTAENGSELWISDGTPEGTVMLKDINIGAGWSSPSSFTSVGNKLYFRANNGVVGQELWVTDGTVEGTVLVKDINDDPLHSSINEMFAFNSKLYFSADDGKYGGELWVSDGTESGTEPVADIEAGSVGSDPRQLIEYNNKMYFTANTSAEERELWVSDGTNGGTTLFKEIGDGTDPGFIKNLNVFDGMLYFNAYNIGSGEEYQIFKSDATAEGTVRVTSGYNLHAVGDRMFFTLDNEDNDIEKLFTLTADGTKTEVLLSAEQATWTTLTFSDFQETSSTKYFYFGISYIDTNGSEWEGYARSDGTSIEIIGDVQLD